jgi:two-component sensor histidine kinase
MQIASEISDYTSSTIAVSPAELLLLREMTHRIKNELTSTICYISLLAARSPHRVAKLALAEVIKHLEDHARLYQELQMPAHNRLVNATTYLRALCQTIARAKLEKRRVELVLVEHQIQLHSLQCWRLGMIISELITNSYRHAFGDDGGTICVELKRRGNIAECRVTDDGSSSDIVRSGHGLSIVRQLAGTLGGNIDLQFGQDGAVAVLSFPMPMQTLDGQAATCSSSQ